MRRLGMLLAAMMLLSATAVASFVWNDMSPYLPADAADGFWDASGHVGVEVSTVESAAATGEGADGTLDLRTFSRAFSNVVGDFATTLNRGLVILVR
ncbi:MAG: hypothetical protein ACI4RD_10090 [Kiritimatiellia bacterium]